MAVIDPEPIWSTVVCRGGWIVPTNVNIYGDRVFGTGYCLDVATGAMVWERDHFRAHMVIGADDGVIVASEYVMEGVWSDILGCYGISLANGDLIWTSHGNGLWGTLWRTLDFVPGFANELRDTPLAVREGRVFCESGRILDIHTGRKILRDRALTQRVWEETRKDGSAGQLNQGETIEVDDGKGRVLRLWRWGGRRGWQRTDEAAKGDAELADLEPASLGFCAAAPGGEAAWTFRISDWDHFTADNFHQWEYRYPFIFILAEEGHHYVPIAQEGEEYAGVRRSSTRTYLLILDVRTGRLVQELALTDGPTEDEYYFGPFSDHGLLLNCWCRGPRRGSDTRRSLAETLGNAIVRRIDPNFDFDVGPVSTRLQLHRFCPSSALTPPVSKSNPTTEV
jgi:hypothetical protein